MIKSSVTDECVGFLSRFSSRVLLLVSSIMWEIDSTSNLTLKGRKGDKSLKIQSTEITKLRSRGPAVFQENRHKLLCIKLFLQFPWEFIISNQCCPETISLLRAEQSFA